MIPSSPPNNPKPGNKFAALADVFATILIAKPPPIPQDQSDFIAALVNGTARMQHGGFDGIFTRAEPPPHLRHAQRIYEL